MYQPRYLVEQPVMVNRFGDWEWQTILAFPDDFKQVIRFAEKQISPTIYGDTAVRIWDEKLEEVVWSNVA